MITCPKCNNQNLDDSNYCDNCGELLKPEEISQSSELRTGEKMEIVQTKEKNIVVGFWLRLLSDVLDALFLGLFGALLIFPFKGLFYNLGENGLWVGFCITFLYTGILQSKVGHGQSLAKKLLGIQVLRQDGTYLSLLRSFIRYTIIALIFYDSWIWLALSSIIPFLNNSLPQLIYLLCIAFLLLGVIILIIFHPLKRGLQDYLVDSLVVRKGMYDSEKIKTLNVPSKIKKAFVILGICYASLLLGSIYLIQKQSNLLLSFIELTSIQRKIGEDTQFKNISIKYVHNITEGTKRIDVSTFLEKIKYDNEKLRSGEIEKLVEIIINSYSKIREYDYIEVDVRTGFNIGIASLYNKTNFKFNVKDELIHNIRSDRLL